MKNRTFLILIAALIAVCSAASADVRTYRQFKDVSLTEDGKVRQSGGKDDLFEYQYDVDSANNTITRTKVRRLDEAIAKDDATVYTITGIKKVPGSEAGRGGNVIVAVSKDGNEILELGSRFAFTTRTSPFSQVITGVYKRVYSAEEHKKWLLKKSAD